MAERRERVKLEPEGSIRVGSVRTFLTEMERFEQEKGFTYFFRGHSRFSHLHYNDPTEPRLAKLVETLFKSSKLEAHLAPPATVPVAAPAAQVAAAAQPAPAP